VPAKKILAAALTDFGYADAPVRVEAASSPDDDKLHGAILGVLGRPGCSRRRAPKGELVRDLAVCIGQSWLLDPTLDQSNDSNGRAGGNSPHT
jgi:hypothetical protein